MNNDKPLLFVVGDFFCGLVAECAVEIVGLIYCSLSVYVSAMPVRVSFVKLACIDTSLIIENAVFMA